MAHGLNLVSVFLNKILSDHGHTPHLHINYGYFMLQT